MMVQLLDWRSIAVFVFLGILMYNFYTAGFSKGYKEGRRNGYASGIREGIRSSQ